MRQLTSYCLSVLVSAGIAAALPCTASGATIYTDFASFQSAVQSQGLQMTSVGFQGLSPGDQDRNGIFVGGLEFAHSEGSALAIQNFGNGNVLTNGDNLGSLNAFAPSNTFALGFNVESGYLFTLGIGGDWTGSIQTENGFVTDFHVTGPGFFGVVSSVPLSTGGRSAVFGAEGGFAIILDAFYATESSTPEPSTLVLLLSGIGLCSLIRQRRERY